MLADRLAAVRDRVQAACARAGRDPSEVGLIAVSKTWPAATVAQAYAEGQLHFGESYAQELRDKGPQLPSDVCWHFVGRLQSNKAKYVAPVAHRVHALETVSQAEALAKRASGELGCLVSVNLGSEHSKGGVPPQEALERCATLGEVPGIRVVGLMTLPPRVELPEQAAPYFAQLAELAATGRDQGLPLTELSMGMSHDFEVAIAHGATWVRVGTAIFGPRQARVS
ncbi:MAG: YggS family pyridoxal phosphate-dependent enzyme [Myxococcales bacterium]|nr:YggS family pyridoxal phosphate-dependent enzyme [Myxococcales bacterium]